MKHHAVTYDQTRDGVDYVSVEVYTVRGQWVQTGGVARGGRTTEVCATLVLNETGWTPTAPSAVAANADTGHPSLRFDVEPI